MRLGPVFLVAAVAAGCPNNTPQQVTSDDGLVTLTVPPGALPSGVSPDELRITRNPTPAMVRLAVTGADAMAGRFTTADERPPLFAYRLEPAGVVFSTPVTATLRMPEILVEGGLTFTLASADGSIESATVTDQRQTPSPELDVQIPHFSEFGAWASADFPQMVYRFLTPPEGATFVVGESFTNVIELKRTAGLETVFRYTDPSGGYTLSIVDSLPGEWLYGGTASHLFVLDPIQTRVGRQATVADVINLELGPIRCASEGRGEQIFNHPAIIPVQRIQVPEVNGLPGTPQPAQNISFEVGMRHTRNVRCVSQVPSAPANAISVTETAPAARDGGSFTTGGPAAGEVEVLVLPPEDGLRCTALSLRTALCEGLSGSTAAGPEHLDVTTATQTVRATRDGGTYAVTPPPVTPLLGPGDGGVTVSAPDGGAVTVPVVPEIGSAEGLFGPPNGLRTEVRLPDGQFDAVSVRAALAGSMAPGSAYLFRDLPAASMTLAAGVRSAPLFDDATISALGARGLSVASVEVGPARTRTESTWFGQDVSVSTARLYRVRGADLEPPPLPGSTLVRSCASLPAYFPERAPGELAVLCLQPDSTCFVTNDIRVSLPPGSAQCASLDRAIVSATQGGVPYANPGGAWRLPYASYGVDLTGTGSSPPFDANVSLIVQHQADGGRWSMGFRIPSSGGIQVDSVARSTGPVPAYGASWECSDTPRTFSTPLVVGAAEIFARLCDETTMGACYAHGHIEATPESEYCRASPYFAALLTSTATGTLQAVARAGHPSRGPWSIESITAGTVDSTRRDATGLPTGADVTLVVTDGGARRFQVVFRYTGTGFLVQSVTRL